MKKTLISVSLIITMVLFTISFSRGQAVFSGPGPILILNTDPTENDAFYPPDANIFSGGLRASCVINVTYVGSWTGPAMAAFNYAVDIWEHTINSSIPISVEAKWEPLPSGVLGSAGANSLVRDFGSTHSTYRTGTFYAIALASKLDGTDLGGTTFDIGASFNSTFPNWYFGTDGLTPGGKWDFVSVVLHEIGHGIGFFSSARNIPPIEWTISTFPVIYDHFILNGSGTRLTTFPVTSAALVSYLQSNDLYWDGTNATLANSSSVPRIYAPTTWQQGSSISHWNQSTFAGGPNALMVPALSPSFAIHNPGPVGVGLLDDIGWDADLWIGIEDWIEISGTGSGFPPPVTVLQEGSNYDYRMRWHDEAPTGDYPIISSIQWRLDVLHKNGTYLLESFSGWADWFITGLGNLPQGYDWHRDLDGRVWAVVSAYCIDNDGFSHYTEIPVGIDYAPGKPYVMLTNRCGSSYADADAYEASLAIISNPDEWLTGNKAAVDIASQWDDGSTSKSSDLEVTSDWVDWEEESQEAEVAPDHISVLLNTESCCNAVEVNFYSYAATSYFIMFRKTNEVIFTLVQIPTGNYSRTINGLDEYANYVFYVGAVNSVGSTLSNPTYRYACKSNGNTSSGYEKISGAPNPADDVIQLTMNDAVLKISRVGINKMDNPFIGKVENFASPATIVNIPVSELSSGWYAATVKDDSNKIYYTKFFKE